MSSRRPIPRYGLVGLAVMAVSETAMLRHIEPFWSWHTCIAWTGYILFVDGLVWSRRGNSWLRSAPRELAFLAAVSLPLWLVFEYFNLFIRNWHYINLPEHAFWRNFGYVWAFATIWPAIFETGELVASFRRSPAQLKLRATSDAALDATSDAALRNTSDATVRAASSPDARRARLQSRPAASRPALSSAEWASIVAGTAMLIWPLLWPSPYLAAPVWLGFIFLLDPLNARAGAESLIGDLRAGRYDRFVNLGAAGLICGVVWEFWNYWARAKWTYTVPIMADFKIFEMPLPGYLGFPAFALECFTMYVFVRRIVWRGPSRPIPL